MTKVPINAFASKRLVAVDLPGPSSNQHELNGVGALKKLFGTETKSQREIEWVLFSDKEPIRTSKSRITFYDARAKSAGITGRSEWRLYYEGTFLSYAKIGDLLVICTTTGGAVFGLVFQRDSEWQKAALKLFRIDEGESPSFSSGEFSENNAITTDVDTNADIAKYLREVISKECDVPNIAEPVRSPPTALRAESLPFRPRARMLLLLGDQLIRDAGIAVFELAKNAYDADATFVDITISHINDRSNARIVIEDDGCGMDWSTIVNVWLEPGTDFRLEQKKENRRSPKFGRLPLGEKGIGRFAAHKLGKVIRVVSRKALSKEVVVEVDWNTFSSERYLSDANVKLSERDAEHFKDGRTGTRIEISDLNSEFSRGVVRQIARSVTSLCSPFKEPSEFKAKLEIIPNSSLLKGVLRLEEVLDLAPYRGTCLVERGNLTYDYDFVPQRGMDRIEPRKVVGKRVELPNLDLFAERDLADKIGDLILEFRIYDLDPTSLSYSVTDKKGFKEFLQSNGGIRVYRDGVRVYDYGEQGNDWLELGGNRVNAPTARISNNQIIGAVHLSGLASKGLIEKTNREGFVENSEFDLFRKIVQFALTQIVHERNVDKARFRAIYGKKAAKEPVISDLGVLRSKLESISEIAPDILPLVDSVAEQYRDMRDTLLSAAGTGLTLSVVIHEVEKAINGLSVAVERSASVEEMRNLAQHLNELIEGLTYLTRKSGRKKEKFGTLVRQTELNTGYRMRSHRIQLTNGIEFGDPDVEVTCTRRLIIATLMNLLDNSIYWLSTKGGDQKRIYLGSTIDYPGGPVLFVADNGPGFQDSPETIIQPFISRKPEGMGLGLHIASQVMLAHGGKIVFPSREELSLDNSYNGAIVGLQFPEEK